MTQKAARPSDEERCLLPVLIVDDDLHFLTVVAATLERAGWRYVLAESGRRALELLAAQQFRAVLLDLILPDVEALDLLRFVRDRPNPPAVVLVSGGATISSAVQAMRLGAQNFVEKPVPMVDLLDILAPASASEVEPFGPDPTKVLAKLILAVANAPTDTRTLAAWADLASVSQPVLSRRCMRVGLHAKQALDLGRLVRVIHIQRASQTPTEALECADERTVVSMLARAGMRKADLRGLGIAAFLQVQQLVYDAALLEELGRALSSSFWL